MQIIKQIVLGLLLLILLSPFRAVNGEERVSEGMPSMPSIPIYRPIPSAVHGVYSPSISLNGSWLFSESPSRAFIETPVEAESPDWNSIVVPGEWAMQGFEVDSASFGGYFREFTLPADWQDKRIVLRFDGVASESKVWVNGAIVGEHLGGLTPFEFDITSEVKRGKNSVALSVRSESLADMLGSLTQYAAHQVGGITRKVTLMALPQTHITDLTITTDLDEDYNNATLKSDLKVVNRGGTISKGVIARISLPETGDMREVNLPAIASGEEWSSTIAIDVDSPNKWTSETPKLYSLSIDLVKDGIVIEHITKRVGFREVVVNGNKLLINGVSVKLKGVNRHEVHPLKGRSLSMDEWRRDVELFIEGNCNFIRTSHYPPAEEFIELCNEKGIFVEVEAPVCWIGHHANKNWKSLNYKDPIYYPYVLQANMEMISFYKNHPSIIFWSMANESYWNDNFKGILEAVESADRSRPQTFHDQGYGKFNSQGSSAAINNIHYPGPEGYKKATEMKMDRPLIYGEYCHLNVYNRRELVTDPGVRNSWGEVLRPTWDNMYNTDGILGGSIWSGIDDIFQMPNGDAKGYGAWGPIDGWRRKKPEFWHMKKVFSPVKVSCSNISSGGVYSLEIENRYLYLNMSSIRCSWSCGNKSGNLLLDIAPGESETAEIEVVDAPKGESLIVEFIDTKGTLVDSYQFAEKESTESLWMTADGEDGSIKTESKPETESSIEIKRAESLTTISVGNLKCIVDRDKKQIVSINRGGKVFISGSPELMALPLDGGACEPDHNAHIAPFNSLCSGWTPSKIGVEKIDGGVEISVKGEYDNFKGSYTLTLLSGDRIEMNYSYKSKGDLNPRQWGIVFSVDRSFNNLDWSREGVWSHYPDDHIGRTKGTTPLFYKEVPESSSPRDNPSWSWNQDRAELGSNDFRSTKTNIYYASLFSNTGHKITAVSDGTQHWRSWLDGDSIKFLVAQFNTAGNELFLNGFLEETRKPISKGDVLSGKVRVILSE